MITHGARRPSARSRGPTCTSTNRRRVGTSRPHGGSSCKRRGTMTAGGHGGATRPTEMGRDHRGDDQPETPRTSGMISVGLGLSGLRPELRICGRRFDSSRGHSSPVLPRDLASLATRRECRPRQLRGVGSSHTREPEQGGAVRSTVFGREAELDAVERFLDATERSDLPMRRWFSRGLPVSASP